MSSAKSQDRPTKKPKTKPAKEPKEQTSTKLKEKENKENKKKTDSENQNVIKKTRKRRIAEPLAEHKDEKDQQTPPQPKATSKRTYTKKKKQQDNEKKKNEKTDSVTEEDLPLFDSGEESPATDSDIEHSYLWNVPAKPAKKKKADCQADRQS
eukprot:TRINITY_DN3673_c0_g1_i1.p1 TRINITY_DN3673_c0_g1~~TRINITY_DN3673_c0_g1_i1.p1  ORF type:complete len:153 (+),score=40.65 TRINITY_DN3673_c0_g1_i1:100-558(+)